MADKCYNAFTFFGNEAALKQVDDWFSALEKAHKPTADSPYSPKSLFDVFLPNEEVNSLGWFGQKWVYPDFGTEIDLNANELGFVSAWGSPDGLQNLLTKKLSLIDSNIVILNSYNSAEHEEAFRYTAIDSNGNVVSEEGQLRLIDEDDEESDFDYQLFHEHQCDSISDLIDAVPGIKKTIAKELKRVEKLFQLTFKT
jgi:hypothetical protein